MRIILLLEAYDKVHVHTRDKNYIMSVNICVLRKARPSEFPREFSTNKAARILDIQCVVLTRDLLYTAFLQGKPCFL